MNPRVSRSSALASKATGYPIAKVAAKLAVGYTLDEIPNDLTGHDARELRADARLRRRQVAALRVREVPRRRHDARHADEVGRRVDGHRPHVRRGVREGAPRPRHRPAVGAREPASVVRGGAGDRHRSDTRLWRDRLPACGLAAPARSRRARTTSTRRAARPTRRTPEPGRSVVILGSGPNRIGQGIEFDYCCVHAAKSFRAQGYEAVMVNCNPETVSTDYDTSDRLYFEPLDEEAVLAVLEREQPVGVCIQFGGQTPLKLARAIERAGFRILGTPFDAIDLAEDRARFGAARGRGRRALPGVGDRAGRRSRRSRSPRGSATRCSCGRRTCSAGARCASATTTRDVDAAMTRARRAPCSSTASSRTRSSSTSTRSATARDTYVAAVMEHVEEAGIHSGDSSCVLPAPSDDERVRDARAAARAGARRRRPAERPARDRRRRGLRARGEPARVADGAVRVEGDRRQPRRRRLPARRRRDASPTSACRPSRCPTGHHVKAAVLPFARFPGADPVLGPEMRSTGEVMASAGDFASAFAKAERAAGRRLPTGGPRVPQRARPRQGRPSLPVARALARARLRARRDDRHGDRARRRRHPGRARREGRRRSSHLVRRRGVDLVVNTPEGRNARTDGYAIREAAVSRACRASRRSRSRAPRSRRSRRRWPSRRARSRRGMPQARAS